MEYITDESFAQLMADSGLTAAIKCAESEGSLKRLMERSVMEWRNQAEGVDISDFERQLAAKDWFDQTPAALAAVIFPVLENYCINSGHIPEVHLNTAKGILPYVSPEFHKVLSDCLARDEV